MVNLIKPHTWRSKKYLAFVRLHPCCNCHTCYNVQAHHALGFGENMMGGKPPDGYAIPLCENCHRLIHDKGTKNMHINIPKVIIELLMEYIQEMGSGKK